MTLADVVKKEYLENDISLCFKTTPIFKIWVLSILSCGFYDLILVFNYWKSLKQNFGYNVSPFFRALFIGITNFWLFSILKKYFSKFEIDMGNATGLALAYFLLCGTGNSIARKTLALDTVNYGLEIVILLTTVLATLIIVNIQNNINKVNENHYPNAPKNEWSTANTVWTVVLALMQILAFLP